MFSKWLSFHLFLERSDACQFSNFVWLKGSIFIAEPCPYLCQAGGQHVVSVRCWPYHHHGLARLADTGEQREGRPLDKCILFAVLPLTHCSVPLIQPFRSWLWRTYTRGIKEDVYVLLWHCAIPFCYLLPGILRYPCWQLVCWASCAEMDQREHLWMEKLYHRLTWCRGSQKVCQFQSLLGLYPCTLEHRLPSPYLLWFSACIYSVIHTGVQSHWVHMDEFCLIMKALKTG